MSSETERYYAARAAEFEEIYRIPERQEELAYIEGWLPGIMAGHDVLEVACGTGYWTERVAQTARSVLATDLNPEMLEVARHKSYPRDNVSFLEVDASDLSGVEGEFTAGLAAFFWSHVRLGALRPFLEGFHAKLGPGRLVAYIDNTSDGTRHPFTRRDEEGNTYQTRRLNDGSEWEVLKNLPTEDDIRAMLDGLASEIEVTFMSYYWLLTYKTL
jgi:SAM-dependent methyltransferase